ncbi:RNA recognition motif domain [Dillenia turbinata]|uniref:RNA recognition motif domain n=1 Tax=Dillenia turbinata TaxID=194707 RepID=A0AAN8WET8_9MAGN
MDPTKKRKLEENGSTLLSTETTDSSSQALTPEDIRKIVEQFTHEQLLTIIQNAAIHNLDVLNAVRSIADRDPSQRKLFIRGLGWDTTTDGLRKLFSTYGELEEAVVILDKATGKSKGYGFITFKHVDGALLALKEPSKKIDGRMTVTQLASAGISGSGNSANAVDVSLRKIYVANVPHEMPADRLLNHFAAYGEIEEGPLGFDKQTGKSRGFALFVYKSVEAAKASLVDPLKNIDGHQLVCKLAIEGKKGKPGGDMPGGDGIGMPPPNPIPGSGYGGPGGPGGLSGYGGFGGPAGQPPLGHMGHHLSSTLSSVGNQAPSSLGVTGGYGSGLVGAYGGSQYGGPAGAGYGGLSGAGGGLGGPASGLSGAGSGSSLYRPGSMALPSGGFPDGGPYGLSAGGYPGQQHQGAGNSPAPRVPPGGILMRSIMIVFLCAHWLFVVASGAVVVIGRSSGGARRVECIVGSYVGKGGVHYVEGITLYVAEGLVLGTPKQQVPVFCMMICKSCKPYWMRYKLWILKMEEGRDHGGLHLGQKVTKNLCLEGGTYPKYRNGAKGASGEPKI